MIHNQTDGLSPIVPVLIQPNIGLDSDVRRSVIKILNNTLADEAVLAAKTRSAHWNVSGAGFIELHILFDSQYKQLNEISDQLAERVRMLGGIAIGVLEEFLDLTRLEDARKCSEDYEDEGTLDLMVSVMRLHEKMAWMLRSYIENEPVYGESQKRI